MNPMEIYEVQNGIMENVNSLWELWLGGTFAVIVAFHVGRDSISKALFVIGSVLYLLASISIVMRYLAYVAAIGELNSSLIENGLDGYPFPSWFPISNSLLTLAIFLFGTVATLVFAYGQRKSIQPERGEDDTRDV
jgi:hypothetical protein